MSPRVQELLALVAAAQREEELQELAKCGSSETDPYMARAKRAFKKAVEETGGSSEVAKLVPCDESNIRQQLENKKRSPTLRVVYALEPDAMQIVIDDLTEAKNAKLGARRAG